MRGDGVGGGGGGGGGGGRRTHLHDGTEAELQDEGEVDGGGKQSDGRAFDGQLVRRFGKAQAGGQRSGEEQVLNEELQGRTGISDSVGPPCMLPEHASILDTMSAMQSKGGQDGCQHRSRGMHASCIQNLLS